MSVFTSICEHTNTHGTNIDTENIHGKYTHPLTFSQMRLPAATLVVLLLTFKLPVRNAERMRDYERADPARNSKSRRAHSGFLKNPSEYRKFELHFDDTLGDCQ